MRTAWTSIDHDEVRPFIYLACVLCFDLAVIYPLVCFSGVRIEKRSARVPRDRVRIECAAFQSVYRDCGGAREVSGVRTIVGMPSDAKKL
eukprot:IDg3453t1